MTSEMVPECTLLAYYYNDQHSEIIADAIKFSVDMSFQNDVSLVCAFILSTRPIALDIRSPTSERVHV